MAECAAHHYGSIRLDQQTVIRAKIKVTVFKTAIEPILLYGSETWTLTKQMERQLDGTYIRLLWRVKLSMPRL